MNFGDLLRGALGNAVKGAGDVYNQYIGDPSGQWVDKQIGKAIGPPGHLLQEVNKQANFRPVQAAPQPTMQPQGMINPYVGATNIPSPTMAPQMQTPQPTQQPYQYGQGLRANFTPDSIRQGISQTWGANTPMLQNVDMLYQAGQSLPQNMDPYLPTILALRETQGGKYDVGKNNPYNIRGMQAGKQHFVDYPDLQTATFGGQNGPDTSEGLVNLISKNPIYQDFQRSGDVKDLWSHWSPQSDGNGDSQTQIDNYNWMRKRFK